MLVSSCTTGIGEEETAPKVDKALPTAVVSSDGWAWQHPLPHGNQIMDIWGSFSSDVFAVGDEGTILHYGDESK